MWLKISHKKHLNILCNSYFHRNCVVVIMSNKLHYYYFDNRFLGNNNWVPHKNLSAMPQLQHVLTGVEQNTQTAVAEKKKIKLPSVWIGNKRFRCWQTRCNTHHIWILNTSSVVKPSAIRFESPIALLIRLHKLTSSSPIKSLRVRVPKKWTRVSQPLQIVTI